MYPKDSWVGLIRNSGYRIRDTKDLTEALPQQPQANTRVAQRIDEQEQIAEAILR
ncbi:hypothetical protein BN4901_0587 [Citrobacter europaeus]|uniref:Uncharacterized protein n=1 Tax=Citrobacter europaeus TaxID=1914243 RepID=A0ABY0JWZ3_9ENTR|nr:hypothetical protein BN4901_0587 [Citrobacter europaeus]